MLPTIIIHYFILYENIIKTTMCIIFLYIGLTKVSKVYMYFNKNKFSH